MAERSEQLEAQLAVGRSYQLTSLDEVNLFPVFLCVSVCLSFRVCLYDEKSFGFYLFSLPSLRREMVSWPLLETRAVV